MKKLFLLGGILLYSFSFFAQNGNFLNPITSIAEIPQSPEAAAFEKFSGSVNMYGGTPTIGIPLYTLEGKEISVPISLSYDASGIKVEQIASNVGLGWNLQAGGVITRNVNSFPDEFLSGGDSHPELQITHSNVRNSYLPYLFDNNKMHGTHATQNNATSMHNLYHKYQDNEVDLQPDTYSVNIGNISGTILIDYDSPTSGGYEAYFLEDPSIKVVVEGSPITFQIIDSSGNIYFFEQNEVTYNEVSDAHDPVGSPDEYVSEFASAWYVTKIQSVNGIDTFNFDYGIHTWTEEQPASRVQKVEFNRVSPVSPYYTLSSVSDLGVSIYKKKHVILNTISYHGPQETEKVVFETTLSNREDLAGSKKINSINIYNRVYDASNPSPTPILTIDFDNDTYFGSGGTLTKRLKLDGVKIYRDNANDPKKYTFSYKSPGSVPSRNSLAMDLWGFYNGTTGANNTNLAPDPNLSYTNIANWEVVLGNIQIQGTNTLANRLPDFEATKIGTLETITYPTGGKSSYTYEAHKDENGKLVGGLRLRKVLNETFDSGENQQYETYYVYGGLDLVAPGDVTPSAPNNLPSNYTSSGKSQQDLIFGSRFRLDSKDENGQIEITKLYTLSNNIAVGVPMGITYTTVSELRFNKSPSGSKFEGCTVTEFENGRYEGSNGYADQNRPFVKENLEYGEIKSQKMYDNNLNLLSETVNDFETVLLNSSQTNIPDEVGINMYINGEELGLNGGTQGCGKVYETGGQYRFELYFTQTSGDCPNAHVEQGYSFYNNVRSYGYNQLWKKLNSTTSTSYEGTQSLTQTTTYTYNGNGHYFPTKTETIDSEGGTRRSELVYPSERSLLPGYPTIDNSELTDMEARNQLGLPVYSYTSYKKAGASTFEPISKQRRLFDNVTPSGHPAPFKMILPWKVQVGKGTLSMEDRMVYHLYDTRGNILEVYYPEGMRHIYIWGYRGDHLLAEIKNRSYADLSAIESTLTSIKNASDNEDTTSEENSLLNSLNALRNLSTFSNSQISVYVYDPGIGVKQMTDVRGYTTRYYYDQHNRLDYATDENNKVLSKNEYNLRVNN